MEYSAEKPTLNTENKRSLEQVNLRNREYIKYLRQKNQFELIVKSFNHIFINDCDSTDINSCMATIDQLEGSVIWINYAPRLARNYAEIIPLVKSKVRAVFSFGPETGFVYWATENQVEFFAKTNSLTEALIHANLYARNNEIIVFAPGAEYDGTQRNDWVTEFKEAMTKLTDKIY